MAFDDFFQYNWDQPFAQAYAAAPPPPARQQAPQRLTLEELLALQDQYQPAPRPKAKASLADLSPDERRRVQQQGLFAGLAAAGAAMSSGNWGANAAAGVHQIQGIEDAALADANARALDEWKASQADDAAKAAAAHGQQQAAALYGIYNRIASMEPAGSPQVAKAEQAARAGDMAGLAKLDAEEPMRQAARSKGYDPDLWDTNARLQEELKAELAARAKATEWAAGGKAQKAEELSMEVAAAKDKEIAIRGLGPAPQAPPHYEPPEHAAAVAEAVEQVRAKYRTQTNGGETGAFGGKVYKQGEKLVLAHPPDATHPQPYVIPLAGQPEEVGSFAYYTDRDGHRYVQDKEHPELGAYEVPQHQTGDKDYSQGFQHFQPGHKAPAPPAPAVPGGAAGAAGMAIGGGLLKPPPPPVPAGVTADSVKQRAVAGLLAGRSAADALANLRENLPAGIGGFTPEQILAAAIQEAQRKGWKPRG